MRDVERPAGAPPPAPPLLLLRATDTQRCRWLGPQAAFGQDGSVGLCLDSSQPVSAGACYQNTIRDLVITAVDVGLYAGKWVNVRDPLLLLVLQLLCPVLVLPVSLPLRELMGRPRVTAMAARA